MALLGALILAAVAMLLLAYVLGQLSSGGQAVQAQRERQLVYYEAEETLGRTVTWLRKNSALLISPFLRDSFYGLFDRSAPSSGANDASGLSLPTRIKLQSTANSAILVSNALLATPAFPVTTIADGSRFDVQADFAGALSGRTFVRLTLMDALPASRSADYGDTDQGSPAPTTDFYPIWRVDVLTDLTAGVHLHAFITGALVSTDLGFYGQDSNSVDRTCDSYRAVDGVYGGANRFANCSVTSTSTLSIKVNSYIYGAARTNTVLSGEGPYRGRVCGDFSDGCPVPGIICEGAACQVPQLAAAEAWSSFCPADQGNLTIKKNTTLRVNNDNPHSKCWNTVTVTKKATLTLVTSDIPYYFKNLVVDAGSQVLIQPASSDVSIKMYVAALDHDRLLNWQVVNPGLKPYQLEFNYWGSTTLAVTSGSAMHMLLYAPTASIDLSGNRDFFGAIRAKALTMSGSSQLHYDESRPVNKPDRFKFLVSNVSEVLQ